MSHPRPSVYQRYRYCYGHLMITRLASNVCAIRPESPYLKDEAFGAILSVDIVETEIATGGRAS